MNITNTRFPQRLIDLVIEQFGDEEYFTQCASDIASHGANAGWNGFVYHSDTVPFGEMIRTHVKPILKEYADEFGEDGIFSMMSGWECLDGYSVDEIAEGWCSSEDDSHTAVMNALAWFALEEVARAYVDSLEG